MKTDSEKRLLKRFSLLDRRDFLLVWWGDEVYFGIKDRHPELSDSDVGKLYTATRNEIENENESQINARFLMVIKNSAHRKHPISFITRKLKSGRKWRNYRPSIPL